MIREVALRNWRSHGEKNGSWGTVVTFEEGLNVIYGINGSGKSSIAEAIAFGLFGIANSPLREILRVGRKSGAVKVVFSADGLYEVKREFSASQTTDAELFRLEDGKRVPLVLQRSRDIEREVEKILGVSRKVYEQVLYASQNNLMKVFRASPGERTTEMDKILGLEPIRKARDTLVKMRNLLKREVKFGEKERLQRELRELRERAKYLEEAVEAVEAEMEGVRSRLVEAEKRREEVKKRRDAVEEMLGKARSLQVRKERLEGEVKATRSQIRYPDATEEDVKRLEEVRTLLEKIRSLEREVVSSRSALESLRKELEGLPEVKETPDPEETMREIRELEERIKEVEKEYEDLSSRLGEAELKVDSLRRRLKEVEKAEREMEELKRRKEKMVREVEERSEHILTEIRRLEEALFTKEGELRIAEGVLKTLSSSSTCPVCGSPLTEERKREIEEENREKKERLDREVRELRERIENLRKEQERVQRILGEVRALEERIREFEELVKERKTIEEELEKWERAKREIEEQISVTRERRESVRARLEELRKRYVEEVKLREAVERRKRIEKELEMIQERLRAAEERIRELLEELGVSSPEEAEAVLRELEERARSWKLKKLLEEQLKELERIRRELSTYEGVEEEWKSVAEELQEVEKNIAELRALLSGKEETLRSHKSHLEEVKKGLWRLEEQLEELEKKEKALLVVERLYAVWERAFREVRRARVEKINEAMNLVWRRLYLNLYADYDEVELKVEETNRGVTHYYLKARLKTEKGYVWRDVSTLSGGEATAAIIAFRIALAYLLTGRAGFLILDEPTHNLDERLTEGLASFLREAVEEDGLFRQIILITHDPVFADYAHVVYEVKRNKEGNDPSMVERIR